MNISPYLAIALELDEQASVIAETIADCQYTLYLLLTAIASGLGLVGSSSGCHAALGDQLHHQSTTCRPTDRSDSRPRLTRIELGDREPTAGDAFMALSTVLVLLHP